MRGTINRHQFLTGFALLLQLVCFGCQIAPTAPDRSTVSGNLAERFGQVIPGDTNPDSIVLPPGASLDDGVTEDEAISIALWNNAAFQELLSELGIARGDLIQAGLLPNPEFIDFFPVPNKPLKYAFEFPIEAVWLRPIRVAAAEQEAYRTNQRLTQAGLDLIRDVRQAYADVILAHERVRVAQDGVLLLGQVATFAQKRFEAGDASEQEAATGRIDAALALQEANRIENAVPIQEERLRNLMGIGRLRTPLRLDPSPVPHCQTLDADALTDAALECRPDALAAADAVTAAEARLKLAKVGWFRLVGIGDATSGRATGHEFGPAVRFTVPLFHWNQGNIARAEAELDRALRNQRTVSDQIILDVQRACLQFHQACAELDVLNSKVQPEIEGSVRRAQAGYREGNISIFIVLETTRRRLETNLREAVLEGDLRRTWAEVERSVGHHVVSGFPSSTPNIEMNSPADTPPLPAEPVLSQEMINTPTRNGGTSVP